MMTKGIIRIRSPMVRLTSGSPNGRGYSRAESTRTSGGQDRHSPQYISAEKIVRERMLLEHT